MQISSYLDYLRQDYINLKVLLFEWHKESGEDEIIILELIVELLTAHSTCPIRLNTSPNQSQDKRPNGSQLTGVPQQPVAPICVNDGCATRLDPSSHRQDSLTLMTVSGRPVSWDNLAGTSTLWQQHHQANQSPTSQHVTDQTHSTSGCALNDLQQAVCDELITDRLSDIQLSRKTLLKLLDNVNIPLPRILMPPQEPICPSPDSSGSAPPERAAMEHGRRRSDPQIVSLPTTDNLQWQDIEMTFISHDSVRISAGSIQKRLHFAEMGFKDGRKGDVPDTRWAILQEFAARNGEITWQDVNPQHSNKLKAAIKDIRKRLKAIFNLDADPFYSYRKVKGYKIKLRLRDDTLKEDKFDDGSLSPNHYYSGGMEPERFEPERFEPDNP